MWIVELNIAGYRVTRQVPDLHRAALRSMRSGRRSTHRRLPRLRHSHAA